MITCSTLRHRVRHRNLRGILSVVWRLVPFPPLSIFLFLFPFRILLLFFFREFPTTLTKQKNTY